MQPPDTLPLSWQRLLALSGVAFAVLFVVGWFASGGDAPDYAAADQEWTEWADDNQWKSRIGAFAMLLAGFVFLHFAGTIRSVLGTAETTVRGSVQLARVAFAGALIGIAGMTTAIVMIAAATSEGADADPVVSRAVATASAGPFLVAAMGFAALLMAAGLLTLRSGVFARWIGIVALLGAISFLITFFAVIAGTRRRQRVRLRLLSWRAGARDLVDRYEHRSIPRGGDCPRGVGRDSRRAGRPLTWEGLVSSRQPFGRQRCAAAATREVRAKGTT